MHNEQGSKYYYEQLSKQQNQQQQQQNPQGGSGQQSQKNNQGGSNSQEDNSKDNKGTQYPDNTPQGKKPIDSHDTWKTFQEMPDAAKQLMQNNINSLIKRTAEQVEKQCGTVPAEFREIVEKLKEKKPEIFNWKAYFRRMLGSIYDVNIKSTRRKQSKRFEGAAGIQHKKKVSILVAVDTSGSVSTKELQDFFSEIEYIYKAGARVTIIECDARINNIVEYDGKHIPEVVGRGGTDFNPPVNYYIKHKKEYASLIYFTDGECYLPDKHPSGMVWVITSNGMHQDFPGKTIYIPKEH
jgi:predicted metal-dependent peptidase